MARRLSTAPSIWFFLLLALLGALLAGLVRAPEFLRAPPDPRISPTIATPARP